MRTYRPDPILWALVSAGLFFPVVGVWLVGTWARGFHHPFVLDGLKWAAICGAAGGAVQTVAVACGLRLTGRPVEPQAEDYADGPEIG
jgi:hypothetical protein